MKPVTITVSSRSLLRAMLIGGLLAALGAVIAEAAGGKKGKKKE